MKKNGKKSGEILIYIMSKIRKNDKYFINVGKYSSADRHLIIDFLKVGRNNFYESNLF